MSLTVRLFYFYSDPEFDIPFAEALYSNVTFIESFYNALSKNGILVMQLGESSDIWKPDETYSKHKNRVATTKLLEKVGFESVHAYEEVRSFCGVQECCLLNRFMC
jgi:spermidine synthase